MIYLVRFRNDNETTPLHGERWVYEEVTECWYTARAAATSLVVDAGCPQAEVKIDTFIQGIHPEYGAMKELAKKYKRK